MEIFPDELTAIDKMHNGMQVYTYQGVECVAPGFPEAAFVQLWPLSTRGDFGNGGGIPTMVMTEKVKPNPYRQLWKRSEETKTS